VEDNLLVIPSNLLQRFSKAVRHLVGSATARRLSTLPHSWYRSSKQARLVSSNPLL